MFKGFSRCMGALLGLALLTMAVPQKAFAYVDPGTGSMLWQLMAAAVIGSLFYLRRVVGWIRNQIMLGSSRPMGFLFAAVFALAASPLTLQLFAGQPLPRFNDIFLVGIVLAGYFFTWESAAFLLVLSILVSAWVLPPHGSLRLEGFAEWYRLSSFTGISMFLICLIARLKARNGEPAAEREDGMVMRGMAAGD